MATSDALIANYKALEALKIPFAEAFPVYAIVFQLDEQTRYAWEIQRRERTLPTVEELSKFLRVRSQALQNSQPVKSSRGAGKTKSGNQHRPPARNMHSRNFSQANPQRNQKQCAHVKFNECTTPTLLSTAVISLLDCDGKPHECRALLDTGAESHFLTIKLADKLQIPRRGVDVPMSGINGTETRAKHAVVATMASRAEDYTVAIQFLLFPKITEALPSRYLRGQFAYFPEH
ncbi:hypothetical protein M0802_007554 [Mischocyttarus mexicanus]|nr:hypothetical protein M0802_007554 [Mischocyttarus mexicanus]